MPRVSQGAGQAWGPGPRPPKEVHPVPGNLHRSLRLEPQQAGQTGVSQASHRITSSAGLLTKVPSREARRAVPEAETETPGPHQPAHSQTTGPGSSASPLARLYPTAQLLESTALARCSASHKFTRSCFTVAAAWGQTLTHGGRRHVWMSLKCPPGGPHTLGEQSSGRSEGQGGGKHFCFLGIRKNYLKE